MFDRYHAIDAMEYRYVKNVYTQAHLYLYSKVYKYLFKYLILSFPKWKWLYLYLNTFTNYLIFTYILKYIKIPLKHCFKYLSEYFTTNIICALSKHFDNWIIHSEPYFLCDLLPITC